MTRELSLATKPRLYDEFGQWAALLFRRNTAIHDELTDDPSEILDGTRFERVRISRGRRSVTENPGAATLRATVAADEVRVPQPGDRVDLRIGGTGTTWPSTYRTRFAGEIHTVTLALNPEQAVAGDGAPVFQIEATDQVTRLSRRRVASTGTWPAEDAATRWQRIADEADAATVPATATGYTVNARDVDSQPAWQLFTELAQHTGAITRLSRLVGLELFPTGTRSDTAPVLTVTAEQADGAMSWQATDTDKVTRATVAYGTADPKAEVTVTYPAAEVFGSTGGTDDRREVSIDSELQDEADAREIAEQLVARRSIPQWLPSRVVIPLGRLALTGEHDAFVADVCALDTERLIRLSGFPDVVGIPDDEPRPQSNGLFWVLGIDEDLSAHDHTVTLHLAPYSAYSTAPDWDDVPDAYTWDDVPNWVTWDTVRGWLPTDPADAPWTDIPANLRWNDVPDSVTWDTADELTKG